MPVKLSHCWTTIKLLLFLLLLVVIFLVVWLRQGPKSLNWAAPYIASSVNKPDSMFTVSFGDVELDWRDITKFGLLKVERVTLSGRDGAAFATLPEVYVSLDPMGFLPTRRSLHTILVQHARLILTRDKEKILRLGLGGDATAMPTGSFNLGTSDQGKVKLNARLPFRRLILHNMSLSIIDEVTETRLDSPNAEFDIKRRFGRLESQLKMPFTFGDSEGSIAASLETQDDTHVLSALIENVPADYICVFANCPEGVDASGLIDGVFSFDFDRDMHPLGGSAKLSTPKATLVAPNLFAEPLEFSASSLEFKASNGFDRLEIPALDLAMKDVRVTGAAIGEKKENGWYVAGDAKADKLDIEKLYKYWPLGLASDSREWITSSLKGGFGENSSIKFNLTPEDFSSENIADKAIDATVHAKNISVNYLPGFPLLNGVNGEVKFTGNTITINADSGSMLTGTKLSKAYIKCTDLSEPATPMIIETTLSAPASDAATILGLKHFAFDDALQLNPATLQGTVTGTLKFNFDAFSKDRPGATPVPEGEISFDNVKYDIDTNLQNIAQPKFLGRFDVTNVGGQLKAANDGMSFDGAANLGANPLKIKVGQQSGQDVTVEIDGSIPRNQFAALGLPDNDRFGEGNLGVSVSLIPHSQAIDLKNAKIDATDMALTFPQISWNKKRGAPAVATITPKGKIYALDIKAQDLNVSGATLALTPDFDLQSLDLPSVKNSKNDFALSYKSTSSGFDVKLTGRRIDGSESYNAPNTPGSENRILADFPPINLTVDMAELVLMPEHPFTNVKGTLNCNDRICTDADLSAKAGKSDIRGTISRPEGARQFALTASDAGDFLRAVDITDRMYGGSLSLKGTYNDSLSPAALPAYLKIDKFTLRNSEILGRILTIASISGLANALTGSGIEFDKMVGNVRSQGGKISISNLKANGASIGITAEGTLDTIKSHIDLKGVLVPAFALNTILGKIPLIGQIAGGDEGLIAFNYSVKGPYADPNVSVNPLSGFTPGFLRGIWGAGDSSDDATTDGAPAAKAATPSPTDTRRHQRGVGQ